MTSEAELKIKIFRLIDTQAEESLQEVYDWLSAKLREKEAVSSVEQGYKDMAEDEDREQQAFEWIESTLNPSDL